MNRLIKRAIAVSVVGGLGVVAACGVMYSAGARVNTSKSIPLGLYWTSSAAITKGEYVIFCPPQRTVFANARERGYIGSGFCPGDFGYMMKKVLAAKGDTVSLTPQGVTVNGELLPHSKPLPADAVGRPLPRMTDERYTLGESELLLMTDRSATSFDARYFGPVTREQVKSVIRPVFTW
ncbi:conjugative transfer signal peptidase TraF [Burkholderia sp. SRS-W-2-2016]|uniref:conjugative transfer signal peptidase TraF n=1 Tax=Burkholderia sp. SRS-W-2-2016 TaxID=1926878 RepID=UPI00094B59E0|nr:conjugative transfer signal peptidase TraF [Burkholderia sp. SRS-W-2-2016]OLL27302.1 conjugative transfer signal peptidase TraF [Burkholderia sp. SRS-W-2-2016]